jgi:hypothetical protein
MKKLQAFIIGLASVTAGFSVLRYEQITGLNDNWLHNKQLIESRVRLNHTNSQNGDFYERAYKTNLVEIGKFSEAFLCASKQDETKCKVAVEF